jgi:hypothetical protein
MENTAADDHILDRWEEQVRDWIQPGMTADDYIQLLESRQELLLGAVGAILIELIERERNEQETATPTG